MGRGTAQSASPTKPTIIPGMQSSNYLSSVVPTPRVKPQQLAPMSAYTQEQPPSITPQPSAGSNSALYGSGGVSPSGYRYVPNQQDWWGMPEAYKDSLPQWYAPWGM